MVLKMAISEITNFNNYPICDTDIWVDIILAKLDDLLFDKYEKIIVANVVEWEIKQFQSNPYHKNIAEKFIAYRDAGFIIVIHHTNIDGESRKLLEKQLYDCNFQFKNGLSVKPHEKHKGEIVSAIYAEFFELPFLKSNDGTFNDGNLGRQAFPDLIVKNRKETINDLVENEVRRKECHQLIYDSRKLMNEGTRIYNEEPATDEQIKQLLSKFRNH